MKFEKSGWYKFHNELNIKFVTDNPDFYNFVDQTFNFFKTEEKNLHPDLEVRVFFYKKNNLQLKRKIAKNLFSDNNQVLYCSKLGFKIYAKENKSFQISTYVWRKPLRDIYNLVYSGRKVAREEKYLTVMRSSLHLPLFYLLEARRYTILHGSAVAKDNKAYLFLGANQVGKTTTALNLIYRYNFKLLSDDFLIIKDGKLYAFPDKIRATPFTLDSLPVGIKSHLIYSKHHFALPSDKIVSFSSPNRVFFIQIGSKPEIKKIDLSTGLKRLNAVHNYICEFPEYSYLAFLSQIPSINDIQARYANFLKDKDIFLFQSSANIDKSLELLLGKLS